MKIKLRSVALGVVIALTFSTSTLVFADSVKNSNSLQININSAIDSITNVVTDASIVIAIKATYFNSPILSPFDIQVITHDGNVALAGTVDSDTQYATAISIASATAGVKSVNADKLTVKNGSSTVYDSYITTKIKAAYLTASLKGVDISALNTHVETKDGVVYLSGALDNTEQVNNAIQIAKSIDGVKAVMSVLTIQSSETH